VNAREAAARLAGRRGRVLLDSASDADGLGRFSFAAAEPLAELEARGRALVLRRGGEVAWRGEGDPLGALEQLAAEYGAQRAVGEGEPPTPVAIGWIGYETPVAGAWAPPSTAAGAGACSGAAAGAVAAAAAAPPLPDLWFGFYGAVYRHDEHGGRGEIAGCDPRARAALEQLLAAGPAAPGPLPLLGPLAPIDPTDGAYRRGFRAVADYLRAGDCYQVNLTRQLAAPVRRAGDPLALYRRLARRAPAPCGALLEPGGGAAVLSASPERFLHRAPGGDRIETRPIKGTRRRAGRPDLDARLAAELRSDDKEMAEHLMIVDLERNDLGRAARTGTVAVDSFARVVALPTVLHLVSTVSCRVEPGLGTAALLAASFPGGSITGAPKRRAMEIIAELEPAPRGVYTGALGYLGQGGALDLAIAIRTAILAPDRLTLGVGGGLVADSTLARELEETEEKAAAWRAALS